MMMKEIMGDLVGEVMILVHGEVIGGDNDGAWSVEAGIFICTIAPTRVMGVYSIMSPV